MEVQKLVTNDLSKLQLGQAQYNLLCNESGGVIDDLVVYRRSEEHTYICVNASNRLTDLEWMKAHLPSSVSLKDESDETALIALQGPDAEELITPFTERLLARHLKYYWAAETTVFGCPCYLSRTGYTGEDGFEIYLAKENAPRIWTSLLEQGQKFGIVPCGLGARDSLRLEMGYPLHGHELSPTVSPLAANLGWVVKLGLAVPFIGQAALRKEAERGPEKRLKAFIAQDRRTPRQGYRILSKTGAQVGEITSGTFSPHLNSPIALGFVDVQATEPYFAEVRESSVPLTVAKLPFVPTHTKKN